MLDEKDLILSQGRGLNGGDFLNLRHVPSGIERHHPGPLKGIDENELLAQWKAEIESELIASKGIGADTRDADRL